MPGDAAACTGTTSITCPSGYTGDGGAGTAAKLSTPRGLAVDVYGNVFIDDSNNNVVRRVDSVTGIITTYAGGATAVCSGGDTVGNGCPASQAALSSPRQLAMDNQGNLLIADFSTNQIRKVDRWTGIITLVAGSSTGYKLTPSVYCAAGFSGDGGAANKSLLNGPRDLAVDTANNLYIVDSGNNAIRRVDGATGVITTVAGQPSLGKATASAATTQLNNPQGISVDASGDVYIADSNNRSFDALMR